MSGRAARHGCLSLVLGLAALGGVLPGPARAQSEVAAAQAAPAPEESSSGSPRVDARWPQLLGAQYTGIVQNQTRLVSPYRGPLSLDPTGDTQPTHTLGIYLGWALSDWAQYYLDTEKFMGAGVSNATGLGGLTNGDVVREGAASLAKRFYMARSYLRLTHALGTTRTHVDAAQDQVAGTEAQERLELKAGWLAVNDDFDHNRYAGGTRTQFMNWSLWADPAWDYAADTRGYAQGFMLAYFSSRWIVRYGAYLMPVHANGQPLESSFRKARGEQLELTYTPQPDGAVLRALLFRNIARMGVYEDALAVAARTRSTPDIVAQDAEGRRKWGWALNGELPLADQGRSGLFARLGWDDGRTESFAFTEVDRHLSLGGQVAGVHWGRAAETLAVAVVAQGLSAPHQAYLRAGGLGFLLGDGTLDYGPERILEVYYRHDWRVPGPWQRALSVQLSPDFQYIEDPGFNRARGPVRFWSLRLHVEY